MCDSCQLLEKQESQYDIVCPVHNCPSLPCLASHVETITDNVEWHMPWKNYHLSQTSNCSGWRLLLAWVRDIKASCWSEELVLCCLPFWLSFRWWTSLLICDWWCEGKQNQCKGLLVLSTCILICKMTSILWLVLGVAALSWIRVWQLKHGLSYWILKALWWPTLNPHAFPNKLFVWALEIGMKIILFCYSLLPF